MRTGSAATSTKWVVSLVMLLAPQLTAAQDEPDMRAIPPFVMIVADTSASMEYLPGCVCDPPAVACTGAPDCTRCIPDCSLPNDAVTHEPPAGKKNRWAVLLEALTGRFTDFTCESFPRTDPVHMTYDYNEPLPYHRPWSCSGGPGTWCAYPGSDTNPLQVQNGLLDNYGGRIRFGLATFDGERTYSGAPDLVQASKFSDALSNGPDGSYSYKDARPIHYPTCEHDYAINSGIRSATAPEGGLISLNATVCANPPCDPAELSAAIQTALLNARTHGGTPTAAALDDLYLHLKEDVNDSLSACRERYAVLITDGYPDNDFRSTTTQCGTETRQFIGCDCKELGTCPASENPDAMRCPYPTAVQAATDLIQGRGSDDPQLSKLFVVGMSISDSESRTGLNAIASAGGNLDTDGDGNTAFFADDPSALTATLDRLLGDLTKPISRSVPAFATGLSGLQYQLSAGFSISAETPPIGFSAPWKGILERRRFVCDKGSLTSPTLEDADRFDVQLNSQHASQRNLWTALPPAPTTTLVTGTMARLKSGTVCGVAGCTETAVRDVPSALFGATVDAARRPVMLDWLYGAPGSVREHKKLGDIYHSSPTIVGPPTEDPGDASYTLFKESPVVVERPVMVYVNSNDGILHAFSLEDYPNGTIAPTVHTGANYKAGHELWGFVPPILLNRLDGQLTAHRLNLDGTPVVKDVYFGKGSLPSATDYHSVLITGMRAGGNAYVALDVTDPAEPKFLWQFSDPDMGETYGQPEIVQARYPWPLESGQPALRAMVILSGGKGVHDLQGPGCDSSTRSTRSMSVPGVTNARFETHLDPDLASGLIPHRREVQCWGRKGRALYFVDVETGQLIKKIADQDGDNATTDDVVFPSPVVGTPVAYQDSVGTVATEGFVLDADGVLWRIDLASDDPRPDDELSGWTVRPFHDLFWDMGPTEGELTYERPILSLDDKHQLVIIVGTGDTDDFEKSDVRNRIVSLTELATTPTPSRPEDYQAGLNWELRADQGNNGVDLVPSELVTGSMALFGGQLFAASFISVGDTADPCAHGLGRMWSLHYRNRDTVRARNTTNAGAVQTYSPERIEVKPSDTSGLNADVGLFNRTKAAAESNLLIQGLGATQRPTCSNVGGTTLSNYFATGFAQIEQTQNPAFWIVAQASSNNQTRNRAGSALGSLELKLDRRLEFSQVSSWAGSVE